MANHLPVTRDRKILPATELSEGLRIAQQKTAPWDIGEIGRVTSFGQDAAGELYITNSGGEILKLVPGP